VQVIKHFERRNDDAWLGYNKLYQFESQSGTAKGYSRRPKSGTAKIHYRRPTSESGMAQAVPRR